MKQLLLLLFIAVTQLSCSPPKDPLVSLEGKTMGTTYHIKYLNGNTGKDVLSSVQIQSLIDKQLLTINQLMSTYIEDSELSLLNAERAGVPIKISAETNYVITEAIKLNKLSDGMLDITVGPLVNLWGFGPTHKPELVPSEVQLQNTLDYVGINKFDLENMMVTKHHDKVYIDLSTIAKGYGVDKIAELLMAHGINNYLVEIGGEMRVSGKKPGDIDWHIAIEKPLSEARAIQRIVSIGNNAIATSGDYRIYFEENGRRYSHLINPKTGQPIQHNLVSVSVVANQSMLADGLATALIVMGKEKGLALSEEENIAALFITKEGDEYREYQSSAFVELVDIKN